MSETLIQRLESLNPEKILAELRTDLKNARTDLSDIQAVVTKLSNGYLTVSSELELLRSALTSAGVSLPTTVVTLQALNTNTSSSQESN